MIKKQTGFKIFSLISKGTAILTLIFSMVFFVSCNNSTDGKIPFSPESELYTFYFEEGWGTFDTENPLQLLASNDQLGFMLVIDCHFKQNLSDMEIYDLDAYIDVYTQSDIAGIYGGNRPDAWETFKDKLILNGKRQRVYIDAGEYNPNDSITEVIHFETKDFYFTLAYNNINEKFEESQEKIHDVIKTLKINYRG